MIGEHPIKQILLETRAYWDNEGIRSPSSAMVRPSLSATFASATSSARGEIDFCISYT